jgi:hypothetical protein
MKLIPSTTTARRYVGISLVDAVGSGAWLPITILYLTRVVGLSAVSAGTAVGLAGILGIVAAPITGILVDAFDVRLVAAAGFLVAGAGFAVLTEVRSFFAFLVVGGAVSYAERTAATARRVLVLNIATGSDRAELFGYERSIRNLGYGIGGVAASAALAVGGRDAYFCVLLLNATTFAAASYNVTRLPSGRPISERPRPAGYRVLLRDRLYLSLAAISSLLWLNDSMLKVGLVVWIVQRTTVPASAVGLLFVLNTVIVVATRRHTSETGATVSAAAAGYRRAGFAILIASALFASSSGLPTLVEAAVLGVAVAALTIGEVYGAAADWGASVGLAREEVRGRYLAAFSLGATAQQSVGPALVSFAIARGGRAGWLALGMLLCLSGMAGRRLSLSGASRRGGHRYAAQPTAGSGSETESPSHCSFGSHVGRERPRPRAG